MSNEFSKSMMERSDEELIRIVTRERSSYQTLALEAAEAEIKNRDIDDTEFAEIQESVAELEKARLLESMNKASLSKRFVNYLIDTFIAGIGSAILIVSWIFLSGSSLISKNLFVLIFMSIMLFSYLGYYYFMESRNGKTLGKYITKTKVVKSNGEPPQKKDILIRNLCRLIPFDRISFLFDNGFHDSISKTKVVNDLGHFSISNPDIVDSDFVN